MDLVNRGALTTKDSISPPSPAGFILWLDSKANKSSIQLELIERPNQESSNGSAATPVIIESTLLDINS